MLYVLTQLPGYYPHASVGESIGLIKPRDWLVNLLGVKPRGTRLVYL